MLINDEIHEFSVKVTINFCHAKEDALIDENLFAKMFSYKTDKFTMKLNWMYF